MYLTIFALLRIFRRQAGAVGIADLLVIVVIADAAQNGMAGDSKSVTEALLLITTIVLWDYFLDFLGGKSDFFKRILEPKEILLIYDGKLMRSNLHKEMISYEELLSQLRQQGIEKVSQSEKMSFGEQRAFQRVKEKETDDKPKGNESGAQAVN